MATISDDQRLESSTDPGHHDAARDARPSPPHAALPSWLAADPVAAQLVAQGMRPEEAFLRSEAIAIAVSELLGSDLLRDARVEPASEADRRLYEEMTGPPPPPQQRRR